MASVDDGSFSRTGFISVGDPYNDKRPQTVHKDFRESRNFLTSPPKRGQTASTLGPGPIDFRPGFVNDPYIDQYKIHARERMRNKAKIRTPNGFRFSSPMKKSASSGDFEGTFYDERSKQYKDQGPLLPHHHQHINFKKGSERNFLTSPLRKGGPGYPARGFGGTDIEYKPEPYDRRRQLARQESALHRKAVGERRAFVSTARRIAQFDDQDHASVSKVYTEDEGCLPPKPDPAAGLTPMEATTTALEAQRKLGVFRPSSPPKTCVIESTFTGFPKFMSEPYDEKGVRAAQKPDRLKPIAVQVEKLPDNIKERKAFMPSAIPKTGLVKSTAKMGLHVH